MSDRHVRPFAPLAVSNGGLILGHIWSLSIKKSQKAKCWKIFMQWEQTLKTRCQGSPCMLLVGGLSCSLRVTFVPLGSMVPTHPMAPVSCTGYECQTCSHMARKPVSSLCYHLKTIHIVHWCSHWKQLLQFTTQFAIYWKHCICFREVKCV